MITYTNCLLQILKVECLEVDLMSLIFKNKNIIYNNRKKKKTKQKKKKTRLKNDEYIYHSLLVAQTPYHDRQFVAVVFSQ